MATKERPKTNYLRAISMGLLLGLCALNVLTNPSDLLTLMQAGETVGQMVGWIGGLAQ